MDHSFNFEFMFLHDLTTQHKKSVSQFYTHRAYDLLPFSNKLFQIFGITEANSLSLQVLSIQLC